MKLNPSSTRFDTRRTVSSLVIFSMLLETAAPAFAKSTGYDGFVTQTPGIYTLPPDVNVMFTLDDSGSMRSEAIPDYSLEQATDNVVRPNASVATGATNYNSGRFRNYEGMPSNDNSEYNWSSGQPYHYPNMWGASSGFMNSDFFKMNPDPRIAGKTATAAEKDLAYARGNIARYMRSAAGNPLYYDPKVTYNPWPYADEKPVDGSRLMPKADPKAVILDVENPNSPSSTRRLDITVEHADSTATNSRKYYPATYFTYDVDTEADLSKTLLPARPHQPLVTDTTKFKIFEIPTKTSFRRYPKRTDCAGAFYDPKGVTGKASTDETGCTKDQELQNFANWLQYYRSRRLMTKGGVAQAFTLQSEKLRVGLAMIGKGNKIQRELLPFRNETKDPTDTNQYRREFFKKLYETPSSDSVTPLRKAMDDVGKYFAVPNGKPWQDEPEKASSPISYSCRRSFHIMSTDGFWNDAAAESPLATKDQDDFSKSIGFQQKFNSKGQVIETTFPETSPAVTPKSSANKEYTYQDIAPDDSDPLKHRFSINPFRENNGGTGNTLADVAAYYWRTDLQPAVDQNNKGLANNVLPSRTDPAFWQHLTTFTVGLGISGSGKVKVGNSTTVPKPVPNDMKWATGHEGKQWLSSQTLRDLLVENRVAVTWPAVTQNDATTGDDLIHAAMVGRGRYFSATNPTDLATGLASALSEAVDQPLELAALAADAQQVREGGMVYQSIFSPAGWYGRLYAFEQNQDGTVNNVPSTPALDNPRQKWEASNMMPTAADRKIFTSQGGTATGAPFQWASLNSAQKAALDNDDKVLTYLRGSPEGEAQNGGTFRNRVRYPIKGRTGGVLGDIVNSSPVKGPDAGGSYNELAAGSARDAYGTYRAAGNTALDSMRNTLFVGANDGMLHGFNTKDGEERFAFVPNEVYSVPRSTTDGVTEEKKLLALSKLGYNHLFTVDGSPNVSDAWYNSAWHTVLTGSNGAGARSIFAINVSDTDAKNGTFTKSNIMWEFGENEAGRDTRNPTAKMGFVLSYPHVAKMRRNAGNSEKGRWMVIFGNGYDSVGGRATLYMVDLADPNFVRAITVPDGAGGNNGLSQPNFVLNDQREVIAIYAGDLKGNLWKFNVESENPDEWAVAFGGKPLFTAVGPAGVAQPISVMPEISLHPSRGAMLSFGTGKMFEDRDVKTDATNPNRAVQSIYGIWDNSTFGTSEGTPVNMTTGTRNSILFHQTPPAIGANVYAQSSLSAANQPDYDGGQRGWVMDLTARGENSGERVNISAQQVNEVLIFVANTPTNEACANGGVATLFLLMPVTGSRPVWRVFDTNNDKKVDSSDEEANVKFINEGILTQNIVQELAKQDGSTPATEITTSPYPTFDRGQATAARSGGVSMKKTEGQHVCDKELLASGALSNTKLSQVVIQTDKDCPTEEPEGDPKPGRVSWRQLQ
jgi:type IV pilus assembly protein PilY1